MKLTASNTLVALTATLLLGCQSTPKPVPTTSPTTPQTHYPTRPNTTPPPFRVFHQSPDTLTLVTTPKASDAQIEAILFQLRDAANTHTFDALHIPQSLVDQRSPMIWFHLYRGPKCAAEKYAPGAPPCGPSYHAAGDFTLGGSRNPNWNDAILRHPDGSETHLWNPDAP